MPLLSPLELMSNGLKMPLGDVPTENRKFYKQVLRRLFLEMSLLTMHSYHLWTLRSFFQIPFVGRF